MTDNILKDRVCMVCGKKFDVILEEGNKIPAKYFFNKSLVKELTGREGEYWECEECSGFKDDLIMKEKVRQWIENYWGERCPDYEKNCPCCTAWKYFDYLFNIDDVYGEDKSKAKKKEDDKKKEYDIAKVCVVCNYGTSIEIESCPNCGSHTFKKYDGVSKYKRGFD